MRRAASRGSTCRSSVSPFLRLTTAPLLTISVSGIGSSSATGAREVKAAAGDERDLDAARRRLDRARRDGRRQPSAAVQQRAVDVDGEEADHQGQDEGRTGRTGRERVRGRRNGAGAARRVNGRAPTGKCDAKTPGSSAAAGCGIGV